MMMRMDAYAALQRGDDGVNEMSVMQLNASRVLVVMNSVPRNDYGRVNACNTCHAHNAWDAHSVANKRSRIARAAGRMQAL